MVPALQVELDSKFKNETCGICGDFTGAQSIGEFIYSRKY